MRVARAFFPDKGLVTVNLGQDIKSLDSVKFKDREDLLKKKLEKEKGNNLVGISDFGLGKITYSQDETYVGVIYASTLKFEGNWSID